MSYDYCDFFKLSQNYTYTDLKHSYENKLHEINNFNVPDIDKSFYRYQVKNLYESAFHNLNKVNNYININNYTKIKRFKKNDDITDLELKFENVLIENNIKNNAKNNATDYSNITMNSYREINNDDNTKTVIEEIKMNNNGEINNIIKSYIKLESGEKIDILYEDAIKNFTKKRKLILE